MGVFLLTACSNNDVEAVESPSKPESKINTNDSLIESFEDHLKEEQTLLNNAEGVMSKNIHKENIEHWEREIRQLEEEKKLLEKTLIYNDDFKVVQETGVYIQKHDGIFTEDTFVSGFNRDMLTELERYKDEISDGAILIAAAPFKSEGDKFPVISVYYSQKSLDRIDFDKALDDDSYLYNNADYLNVHNTLSSSLSSKGNFDVVPDLFIHYNGITY